MLKSQIPYIHVDDKVIYTKVPGSFKYGLEAIITKCGSKFFEVKIYGVDDIKFYRSIWKYDSFTLLPKPEEFPIGSWVGGYYHNDIGKVWASNSKQLWVYLDGDKDRPSLWSRSVSIALPNYNGEQQIYILIQADTDSEAIANLLRDANIRASVGETTPTSSVVWRYSVELPLNTLVVRKL